MGGLNVTNLQPTWIKHRFTQEKKELDTTDADVLKNAAGKADAVVSKVVGAPVALASATASGDAVKAATEAAKAVGQTVATTDTAKSSIANGATMVAGVTAAAKGDTFGAAVAAKAVLEKTPALAPLALAADVLMLSKGDDKIKEQAKAAQKSLQTLASPTAGPAKKIKSGLDLATNAQATITLGQQLSHAVGSLGKFLERAEVFRPLVSSGRSAVTWLMETPLGSVVRGLGKVLPFLNVAALANSVWVSHAVWKDRQSSTTTKALAAGSIVTSAGLFLASVSSVFAPFLMPVALAGMTVELGLFYARRRDQDSKDTDKVMVYGLTHPLDALKLTAKTLVKGGRDIANWLGGKVKHGLAAIGV
ncbi:MAG TPA: hypothetical protein V6D05_13110 [Stenomitos sp.]